LCFEGSVTPSGVTASPVHNRRSTSVGESPLFIPPRNPLVHGESRRQREPDGRFVLIRRERFFGQEQTMAASLEKVREIAERVAQSSGLEVVDIELLGGGKVRMLRIFIDKPDGVTHEDCSSYSAKWARSSMLKRLYRATSYLLEVSSPGLDRKLSKPADYQRFTGSLVKLMTRDR